MIVVMCIQNRCCPVNFQGAGAKSMNLVCKIIASSLIDMISTELRPLLHQGDGQGEGLYMTEAYPLLTPSPQPSPCGRGS